MSRNYISKNTVDKIISARSVVFFTGAGISAESGIPIFRGKDGIWNKLKPDELANFNSFLKNPDLVWEWYNHRKKVIHESEPNKGHLTIAEFEKILPDVIVVTQNIDNLHKRAGSTNVYELHGNIERNYCIKCNKFYNGEIELKDSAPRCECGGLIRPDVVWFGEYLPQEQFIASEKAAQDSDVFFIVGTSAVVYPAASLIYTAKENGAYMVEINLEPTEASGIVNDSLLGKAGDILPDLLNEVKNKLS